ncbi:MAG: SPOR domain-containing protein [Desulfosporosinus sp.]|nr:SPOR domain-containing protein [Desulfosporosinus sp.]
MKGYERIRIVIVLVLGMMALGLLTWGIGKVYLELVGQSSRVKVEGTQKNLKVSNASDGTVLVLPEATFWTCQLGVFQNEGNAQLSRDKFRVLAFNAEVIGANPWIVGIGLAHSANELKGMRQTLIEKGIPTVPKQIVLPERSFRVAGNGSQLTVELLTNVNSILQKGLTTEALTQEKQSWEALAGDHPPKELEALHQLYDQIRIKTNFEEQSALGLSLYFDSQKVINKFSGK